MSLITKPHNLGSPAASIFFYYGNKNAPNLQEWSLVISDRKWSTPNTPLNSVFTLQINKTALNIYFLNNLFVYSWVFLRIFRTKNSDGKEVSRRFWTISYLLHGTAFGKIDFGKYRTTSPQFRKGRTVILSPSYKSNTLIKRSKVPSPQPHRTATGKQ